MECNRPRFALSPSTRRIILRAIAFAIAASFICGAAAQQGAVFGSGSLVVGMTSPAILPDRLGADASGPDGSSSAVVAQTVQELLPDYLRRTLERGLDRQVVVTGSYNSEQFTSTDGRPLGAIIESTIANDGVRGIRVTTKISARVGTSTVEGSEVLLLSPRTDYGQLDEKMTDLGMRTARRLAQMSSNDAQAVTKLPRGVVRFYCVRPTDTGDRNLAMLARRLTIELPAALTEASNKQGLDMVVRGLEIREVITLCDPSMTLQGAGDMTQGRIESFSWDGTVSSQRPSGSQLSVRISDPNLPGGNYRRITQILIKDTASPAMSEIAEKIVAEFIKQYQKTTLASDVKSHIDWSIRDSTNQNKLDCPEKYTEVPQCVFQGGRACYSREAIVRAKKGDCAGAMRLMLVTQCHNPTAQQSIKAAGEPTVCDYLKSK